MNNLCSPCAIDPLPVLFTNSINTALVKLQTPSIAQYFTVVPTFALVFINLFVHVWKMKGPAKSRKMTVPGGEDTPSVLGCTLPSL